MNHKSLIFIGIIASCLLLSTAPTWATPQKPKACEKSLASTVPTKLTKSDVFVVKTQNSRYHLKPLKEDSFWSQDQMLMPSSNKTDHITYSFDSEILLDDFIRLARTDLNTFKRTRTLLKKHNYTTQELAEALELSEKQVLAFAVRSNYQSQPDLYNITDLNPTYFEKLVDQLYIEDQVPTVKLMEGLMHAGHKLLNKRGLEVDVELDMYNIEYKHSSWSNTPKDFYNFIRDYHNLFKAANTHLHIGLPASTVPKAKAKKIAKAIETRIILERAYQSDNLVFKQDYMLGSPLMNEYSRRGFVLLGLEEWSAPHLSHNLEIRYWNSISHGMKHLEVATKLASTDAKLLEINYPIKKENLDYAAGNIGSALIYAGEVLLYHGQKELGHKMVKLGFQVRRTKKLTQKNYTKVHTFLRQNWSEINLDYELWTK